MSEFLKIPQATKSGFALVELYGCFDMSYPGSRTRRGRSQNGGGVCPAITCAPEIYVFEGYEET